MRMNKVKILNRCGAAICFVFAINFAFSDEISVAGDPWCPFTCDSTSDRPGLIVEVTKEVLGAVGHKVTYKEVAWARAVNDTRDNKINAVAGALKGDAPDFIFPSVSWANQKSCFFVKKGSAWKYKGVDSLKDQKIGAVQDYTYGEPFDTFVKKSKTVDLVSGTGTTVKLFKKLLDNRVGIIIEDESVAAYNLANDNSIDQNEILKVGCLKASPLYVAFSPKNPKSKDYAKSLSESFKKFKTTPKMKEILSRYGL